MADLAPSPVPSSPEIPEEDARKILLIFVLAVVSVLFLFLLHVLGSLRRRTSQWVLHAIVTGTYSLSYALVGYTLGLMRYSSYYFVEFPVWAVCLLLLLGSTDTLTVCRLSDIDNWKSLHASQLIKVVMAVYVMVYFSTPESRYLQYPLWAILLVNALKLYGRITAMKMASKSHLLFQDIKLIADYMKHEHKLPSERTNPETMEGYRYIIAGEHRQKYRVQRPEYINMYIDGKDTKITTVEQIWQCDESLLRCDSANGQRLKDLCLSMALSKMLNRRFGGFELAEVGLQKTHDFMFRGLLAGNMPHERAFRVIETELAFVHDLYYTRYPYYYKKGRFLALCLPVAMVILCSWLTSCLFMHVKHYDHPNDFPLYATRFMMATVTFLELFQLYLHIASGWFKVELIRSYVIRTVLQGTFFGMVVKLILSLKTVQPWQNKLGQYSLLHKFEGKTRLRNCFYYVTLCLVDRAKDGRKSRKLVKLSKHVKDAVIASLIKSDGHLTNGVRSLRKNGVHERLISWACDASNTQATHTILIWHIATTLCKHQLDSQAKHKQPTELLRGDQIAIGIASSVASDLSQYCAYLVAFMPNLLPDHSSISSLMLDEVINEARDLLRGSRTMESKYGKLMSLSSHGNAVDVPLVVLGARLARQLTEDIQDLTKRWGVLSDFWAEMVLYIAPSDDSLAQLETLSKGGEFVTHLWALLTHGGVLKRSPVAAV